MIRETNRLILRELTADDYSALCTLLQDAAVMYAYAMDMPHDVLCSA